MTYNLDSNQGNSIDELLYGHGNIQGITSVSANKYGKATVWVRDKKGIDSREEQFKPFVVLADKNLLEGIAGCEVRELKGNLEYKWLVEIQKYDLFKIGLLSNYNKLNTDTDIKDSISGLKGVYSPNFAEQYLIQSGNTYYKGMKFNDVVRMQIDIETTGLKSFDSKIFMISVKCTDGFKKVIHGESERSLFFELNDIIKASNPDVIENHNIFEFDLPFLIDRYRANNIHFNWGRRPRDPFSHDDSLKVGEKGEYFERWNIEGREIVDTLQSVKRYDSTARIMEGRYGLKHVAKILGVARDENAYIDGDKIYSTYRVDPELVKEYAAADVNEVDSISMLLHQDKFFLAQMVPMRFQKICTTGTSRSIEYPLVRAYLKDNHSLPNPTPKINYEGGMVEVQKVGLFNNAIKIDVASMYPTIILNNNIGPRSDPLNIFIPFLSKVKETRLQYKKLSKEDKSYVPLQGALKIVINASYGYLGSEFGLFNNPEGAEKTTAIGRQILQKMLGSIEKNGGDPIEADTDGIICEYPGDKYSPTVFSKLIQDDLKEFKGIEVESESENPWTAVYVYKMKSYATLHNGKVKLTGAALRSKSIELIFKTLIDGSLSYILNRDLKGFLDLVKTTHGKIMKNKCTADEIKKRMVLGKSIYEYQQDKKKTLPQYEVMIAAGLTNAKAGVVSEYYESKSGAKHISQYSTDYDVSYYLESLKNKMEMFRFAFDKDLFKKIIDFDFKELNLSTPFTNYAADALPRDIEGSPLSYYQRMDILSRIDDAFRLLNDDLDMEYSFENLTVSEDKKNVVVHFTRVRKLQDAHGEEYSRQTKYKFKIRCSYSVKYDRLTASGLEDGFFGLTKKFYQQISSSIEDEFGLSLNPIPEL